MRGKVIICAIAGQFCVTGFAFASGSMSMPEITTKYDSFSKCKAVLIKAHKNDILAHANDGKVTYKPANAGSVKSIHLTEFQTKGVILSKNKQAHYETSAWYHHGGWDEELGKYRISHSYDRMKRHCDGALLRTVSTKGYTLETFDDSLETH